MQDNFVRQSLLGEQGELLAVFDLGRRQFHELLGRTCGARQQPVGGSGPVVRRELITQIFEKGASPALSEKSSSFGHRELEEIIHIKVGRIVEVCDAANGVVVSAQGSREIGDVIAVTLHLKEWMLEFAMHSLHHDQPFVALVQLGTAPLLELDDHVCIPAGAPINAREYDVGPLAGEREPVLDQHLDIAETGLGEIVGQYRETAPPGLPL